MPKLPTKGLFRQEEGIFLFDNPKNREKCQSVEILNVGILWSHSIFNYFQVQTTRRARGCTCTLDPKLNIFNISNRDIFFKKLKVSFYILVPGGNILLTIHWYPNKFQRIDTAVQQLNNRNFNSLLG